jgi:hypothetical protein
MSHARLLRWVVGAVAGLALLVIAALAAVPYIVDTPRIQGYVAASATQALGRPVTFGALSLRVLPLPAVELHDLEVAEDPKFGSAPFLRLKTGRIRLRLLPLLTGRVELGDILLDGPVVTLVQAADGRLNVSTLGAGAPARPGGEAGRPGRAPGGPGAGGAVAAARAVVDRGVVTFVARGAGGALTQYRVDALALTLAGGGNQLAFKGAGRIQPGGLAVTLSDGLVTLNGGRPLAEASLRGRVALDGKDITDLAAVATGPALGVGGALKGSLTLGGTLGAPTAAGEITLAPLTLTQTQPRCAEPRRRTLTLPSVRLVAGWQEPRLTGRPLTAALADGTVTGQLTVTLGGGVRVELADLAVKTLPLEKVLVDFLCQGYAVTGPLDLTGGLAFEAHDALGTLSGPGRLRIGRGRVVGSQALALIGSVVRVGGAISALLSADLPTRMFDSPLEFDSITATYQLAHGVASTKDLLYTSRAMRVAIAGDYGLVTGRMNLDLVVSHGRGEIKAMVTGTTTSPSVRVVPSTLLRDVDRGKTEKGLQDLLKRFTR